MYFGNRIPQGNEYTYAETIDYRSLIKNSNRTVIYGNSPNNHTARKYIDLYWDGNPERMAFKLGTNGNIEWSFRYYDIQELSVGGTIGFLKDNGYYGDIIILPSATFWFTNDPMPH